MRGARPPRIRSGNVSWLPRGGAALAALSALYFATLLRPQTFASRTSPGVA